MSRRNFLKQIGLATAAIGVAPISRATVPIRSIDSNLKIGLLLPVNNGYPQLSENYLTGFKTRLASLNTNGVTTSFHTEYYKISEYLFRQKAESLLTDNRVDIIIAHASINLISAVQDLFDKHKKILIASILGEKIPVKYSTSPYILVNSFNLWQSSWAAGKWAANTTGKKAAIVDSFYDSGFDSGNSFKIGFESSGGSEAKTFMAELPGENIDTGKVIAEIKDYSPDVLFVNLSGQTAVSFLKVLLTSNLKRNTEVIASPFAMNEEVLPHIGTSICGVKSFSSWSVELNTKANSDFKSQLQGSRVENPDVFHLLGYESALMIEALQKSNMSQKLLSPFESFKFVSPRGVVELDIKNHITQSPCNMRMVELVKFDLINRVIGEELADISSDDNSIKNDYSGLNSGWINPYLTT